MIINKFLIGVLTQTHSTPPHYQTVSIELADDALNYPPKHTNENFNEKNLLTRILYLFKTIFECGAIDGEIEEIGEGELSDYQIDQIEVISDAMINSYSIQRETRLINRVLLEREVVLSQLGIYRT
jgi:hypothetical protein